ncbi:hypothetical protein FSP39_018041 [Pinctada imbricata]|uniref:Uncharacterized protein n=1 Tax=Pinctada imbricata TaxID=66713 RepID=A0AA89C7P8_PINIB|nr:hypothetical protein FSP39_018041 [Pinctada imbricata]
MDGSQLEQDGRVLEPHEPHYPTIVVIHRNMDNESTASYQNQTSIDFRYMLFTATSTETLAIFLRHIRWSVVRSQHANISHVNGNNNDRAVINVLRHNPNFWNHINNIRQRGYVPFRFPFMCLVVASDVNIVDYVTREEEDLGQLVHLDANDFEVFI